MLPGHLFGATGAGDVKLFAAAGTLLGPSDMVLAFVATAIAGGVLATRRRGPAWPPERDLRRHGPADREPGGQRAARSKARNRTTGLPTRPRSPSASRWPRSDSERRGYGSHSRLRRVRARDYRWRRVRLWHLSLRQAGARSRRRRCRPARSSSPRRDLDLGAELRPEDVRIVEWPGQLGARRRVRQRATRSSAAA